LINRRRESIDSGEDVTPVENFILTVSLPEASIARGESVQTIEAGRNWASYVNGDEV